MDKKITTISLVIPVFNEAQTLPGVLRSAISTKVDEIIVVDDGSTDASCSIARSLAATDQRITIVRNASNRGVGATRARGIQQSKGEIVVFIDSDIQNPSPQMITSLYAPILESKADFVLASFTNMGRVTELTAKPLLTVCFPALSFLNQPISGQFAIKRQFLFPERIEQGNAMLGVVLDAYLAGARISEIDIGEIDHSKREMNIKKQQAIAECRACITRFVEYNKMQSETPLVP